MSRSASVRQPADLLARDLRVAARAQPGVDDIEGGLRARGEPEVTSKEVGRLATEALRDIDQLAYIRFASVYHRYEDIGDPSARSTADEAAHVRGPLVILSDRTIREEIAAGRIVIDPLAEDASSRRRSTCTSTATSACSATTRGRSST